MKNKKGLIVLLCLILIIAFVFVYFAFFNEKDNFIKNIFGKDEEVSPVVGINDNYNGVYTYIDNKGQSITVFNGCTFSYVSNYIIVNGASYKMFRSSCLGTFYLGGGATEDLKFIYDDDTRLYDLDYDGKIYEKDLSVRDIEVKLSELSDIKVEYYKIILDEVKYSSSFHTLSSRTIDKFTFKVNYSNGVYTTSLDTEYGAMYSYSSSEISSLPDVNILNKDAIIFEKNNINGKYNDKLFVYNSNGLKYSLVSNFPVYVDGVALDYNYSVLLDYNANKKKYVMYVGYDQVVCSQEVSNDYIVYYEFDLEYDYYNRVFKKPYFIGFGRGNDACKKMKELVKER